MNRRKEDEDDLDPNKLRSFGGLTIPSLLGFIISVLTICGLVYAGISNYAYPKTKGEILEQGITEIKQSIKEQTLTLTKLRLALARKNISEQESV